MNAFGERVLGAPAKYIRARRIDDFTPPETLATMSRFWDELRRRGPHRGTAVALRADGSRVTVSFHATPNLAPGLHVLQLRSAEIQPVRGFDLTARERQVLQLAADGRSRLDIAELLVLSPGTVKTHFQNIFAKLAVRDRTAAVAEALRQQLIH